MTDKEISVVTTKSAANVDICFCKPHESKYGLKVYLDSPYEAQTDIRHLGWNSTHRQWDAEERMWELDLGALAYSIDELTSVGYSVAVTNDIVKIIK